jgi:hypothetical protein
MSRKKLLGLGLPELLAAKAVWEEIRNRDNFSCNAYEALMILMSRELELKMQYRPRTTIKDELDEAIVCASHDALDAIKTTPLKIF